VTLDILTIILSSAAIFMLGANVGFDVAKWLYRKKIKALCELNSELNEWRGPM
jgi:hypothetical protein